MGSNSGDRYFTGRSLIVRGIITIILGAGVVFTIPALAILIAAGVYVAAGVIHLRELARHRNEAISSLPERRDFLLRREGIWLYLIIAVGYEAVFPEGVVVRAVLAVTTGVLVYIGGICTQTIRRLEGRPISYRKYLERATVGER